jgi:hypothetical protein
MTGSVLENPVPAQVKDCGESDDVVIGCAPAARFAVPAYVRHVLIHSAETYGRIHVEVYQHHTIE